MRIAGVVEKVSRPWEDRIGRSASEWRVFRGTGGQFGLPPGSRSAWTRTSIPDSKRRPSASSQRPCAGPPEAEEPRMFRDRTPTGRALMGCLGLTPVDGAKGEDT